MNKKLVRSSKNCWVGGVFGGIGECYQVDPNLLRLIWIVGICFSAGTFFLLYLAAWFLIPEE